MLPTLLAQWSHPGLGRANFDFAAALRVAEAAGVDPAVAAPLVAAIQSGVRRAQQLTAENRDE